MIFFKSIIMFARLTIYYRIFLTFSLNDGLFCRIMSVPHILLWIWIMLCLACWKDLAKDYIRTWDWGHDKSKVFHKHVVVAQTCDDWTIALQVQKRKSSWRMLLSYLICVHTMEANFSIISKLRWLTYLGGILVF